MRTRRRGQPPVAEPAGEGTGGTRGRGRKPAPPAPQEAPGKTGKLIRDLPNAAIAAAYAFG